MDATLVYRNFRDDALAWQLESREYKVFVAMPFGEQFSYCSMDIYTQVFKAASRRANELLGEKGPDKYRRFGPIRFGEPRRLDDQPQTGRSISVEIVKEILYSHAVIADLTYTNDGVMLEVGLSLAFKPTEDLVLCFQGKQDELHFDIAGNTAFKYTPKDGVEKIASALVKVAENFERRRDDMLTSIQLTLSRDAIWLLNWYGKLRNGRMCGPDREPIVSSLFESYAWQAFLEPDEAAADVLPTRKGELFTRGLLAIRELLARRLMFTDYRSQVAGDKGPVDYCVYRGTRLGWMFIEKTWPKCGDDPGLQCPANEFDDLPTWPAQMME